MTTSRPDFKFLSAHPAHLIAFGFGSGLAPKAPGTVGTLLGLPLFWLVTRASETLKEKAQEELEAVKKDSQKIGPDARQSAKELPSRAREEFKKTGTALKETGKELKESTGEAVQTLKELFNK